jgi:hypothetical protein
MNPKFLNIDIYKKAKKIADEKHKKHSAYKSMFLIKTYKDLGGKINEPAKSGTKKWLKEKWVNLTPVVTGKVKSVKDAPKCGVKGKSQKAPSVCRPTVKVDKKTPQLAQKYSKSQLKKALETKKKGGVINWKKL